MVDLICLIHEEIHESADPGRRKGERVREKEVLRCISPSRSQLASYKQATGSQ